MIVLISGSSSAQSSNTRLLKAIAVRFRNLDFTLAKDLGSLPVFTVQKDRAPWPEEVASWRSLIGNASHVIISTPAYLQNIPAVLKNALEWLTTSGELHDKPVLAMTYTPVEPRGAEAMQSLLWSLTALNARVVAQCALYQTDVQIDKMEMLIGDEGILMIEEALGLLTG